LSKIQEEYDVRRQYAHLGKEYISEKSRLLKCRSTILYCTAEISAE
jgi:hypothetical protein